MDNELKKQIGVRLKKLRQMRGLTQEILAEKIDRTVETVSNLERGNSMPSIVTLLEITRCLDVPISDVLIQERRKGHRKHVEMEAQAVQIIRNLPDDKLAIAVKQLRALEE